MIRKATCGDIEAIAKSYDELLAYEAAHGGASNWQPGVYPTADVPRAAVPLGTMYVLEEDGELCASMVLNQDQLPEYADIPWEYEAGSEAVLVIHTLCIPPSMARRGCGRKMVAFAKEKAREMGCAVVRIDTYAHNEPAKALYRKCGFRIAGYARLLFQGLIPEELVFLEYRL